MRCEIHDKEHEDADKSDKEGLHSVEPTTCYVMRSKLTNRRSMEACFSLYSFARAANSRYIVISECGRPANLLTDLSLFVVVVAKGADFLLMLKLYLQHRFSTQRSRSPVLLRCGQRFRDGRLRDLRRD